MAKRTRPSRPDPKVEALRVDGALNRHADQITDPVFGAHEFFDARDLVQVKYEMLRRVEIAPAWALRQTSPEVVAEIDRLLAEYTDVQIARELTERGFRSGTGKPVDIMMVARVRDHYHLKPRYERLRDRGLLTLAELASALQISTATAKHWRRAGLLRAHAYNDKPQYLFEPPGAESPSA